MANLNPSEGERQWALGQAVLKLESMRDVWPDGPWTLEDQATAFAEGWSLAIFLKDRREYGKILPYSTTSILDAFGGSNEKAAAFVKARAEQGSDLHQRALVLHITATLKLNA